MCLVSVEVLHVYFLLSVDSISEDVDENQPPNESRQMVAAQLVRIDIGARNAHDVQVICQSVLQMSLCR